jgi:hypothetical protein
LSTGRETLSTAGFHVGYDEGVIAESHWRADDLPVEIVNTRHQDIRSHEEEVVATRA